MRYTLTVVLALGAHSAFATSMLVVDRGLPTANLNNASGGDRSNVAWSFGAGFPSGDTFTLAPTGDAANPLWRIDSLSGWFIAGAPGDPAFTLDSRYDGVSLFLGPNGAAGDPLPQVATSSITGNMADAANVAITPVTYADGSDYQTTSGAFSQIWEVTFSDLGLFAPGDYAFSIDALLQPDQNWFNHASNAALGGVQADGADDFYLFMTGLAADPSIDIGGPVDSDGFGWDKSSDINVQVMATVAPVPVPAALPLLAAGMGALALMRRRRATA